MGNCVSFQPSCDKTVDRIITLLCDKGYIRNLKENLRDLEREMEDLKAIQLDVLNKVEREERLHRQRLKTVQVWLTRVESIDTQVNNLLSTSPIQFQKLCLCGLCSKNVCSSYKYGKSVFLSLEDVKKLQSKGNFEIVTELAPRYEVEERPIGPTIGLGEMLEKAWNRLMEDGVGIMGLHGMGGVGKTTLFKKIHNKFVDLPSGRFDVVIWVVVSQGATISKIQEDIAQKLLLCDDKWTKKNISDKATEMHKVLKGRRFVLMLDDIWEKVDLEAIGVPFPTRENGCKVAFTTRSRDVCGRMGDHEPMQVKYLEQNEAWELFKSKVGDNTLGRDPLIVDLARKVAAKCDGLPLALIAIGEKMASKTTIQEWENAAGVLSEPAFRSEVEERPTGPTIGQEIMLEKAWNRIMEDGVGIMGLHGMGGVGKTTLFKKIHNKFAELACGSFDVVIWIVVSQGAKIPKIQEDIAQKLHLCGDEWAKKNESDKATEMYKALKGKRFVLMLDDIWEKVDLEAIGVPFPNRANGCKVAFTTRSQEVCGRMGDHTPMQVNCLEESEAWELFKSKAGDNTLKRDPAIVELARKVAAKCDGLPLALNVIGETMASKTTVQEWEHAVDVLTKSAAEFSDMEIKILPILKYSYDSLADEHIKLCFLYCALFPEDYEIIKEKLIDYWICEGFIGEYQAIRRAKNKGYDILGTLIRTNLLTEDDGIRYGFVVMHDVIREMALWIASDFGEQKENFVVQARVGLLEMPKVKDWGAVRRMSLMYNKIENITCNGSKCSKLTTLLLQDNTYLRNISGEFIQFMQKLLVLDLSENRHINELPEQISELALLQYLDLSSTYIKQLPVCLQGLRKLIHLNLACTMRLCSINGISKLSSLRILKLRDSHVRGDVSLVKELQLLEHLEVLTITISSELALKLISGHQRLANCFDDMYVDGYQQTPLGKSEFVVSMESIHVSEINTNMKCGERETKSSVSYNPTSPCFTNLSKVRISNCSGIKDLTWLLFAPNLVKLEIDLAVEMEEIINKERVTNLTGIITPFQKLETLLLSRLPKLNSIYWSPLPFPFLKQICVSDCPKLRKLPLNATSVPRLGGFSIRMNRLKQNADLEWEDEDTKSRFLPFIQRP